MDISRQQIQQLGSLARLELSEPEFEQLADYLPKIVAYVGQLQNVDTSAVPEPDPSSPALRPDRVEPSAMVSAILAQAPDRAGDNWKVEAVFS